MKRPLSSLADVYERWISGRCGKGRPPSAIALRRLYDRWRQREYYRNNIGRRRLQRRESKRQVYWLRWLKREVLAELGVCGVSPWVEGVL